MRPRSGTSMKLSLAHARSSAGPGESATLSFARSGRSPVRSMATSSPLAQACAAARNRYVHSSAKLRVSQKTMGTLGQRTCSSANPSAISEGRTYSCL